MYVYIYVCVYGIMCSGNSIVGGYKNALGMILLQEYLGSSNKTKVVFFHLVAISLSLRPLVGKNLSLTIREDSNHSKGSIMRPIYICVRNTNANHSAYREYSTHTGVDYFRNYIKNGGKALVREKRAVRPTKRYNNN